MTTLIICLTVIFCVVWITLWIKWMVSRNLPLFTYGQCVWKENTPCCTGSQPIGFVPPEEVSKETPAEKPEQKKTDKEIKEELMQDPVTLCASLLRGEVDIDDVTI